jgi:enoyl-CoA hydratase
MHTIFSVHIENEIARLSMQAELGKPPVLEPLALASLDCALIRIEKELPRVVIVESSSEKFFCLGADLKVLRETTPETIAPWVKEGHRILNKLEDLPCPTIAKVAGFAMGGGLEIAMACDFIYATTAARFGQTEAGIGFIPGWGGTLRLAERISKARAKHYFYTGDLIDGATAAHIGLADFFGDATAVDAEIARVTQAIVDKSGYAVHTFKKILHDQRIDARNANASIEADASRACAANPDTLARIETFLNRKK